MFLVLRGGDYTTMLLLSLPGKPSYPIGRATLTQSSWKLGESSRKSRATGFVGRSLNGVCTGGRALGNIVTV